MQRAGFVLVGGSSSRMGRDKALLPYGDATLVEHVAAQVAAAAGCVTLVGSLARGAQPGLPVIPDNLPGCGPLAGIQAALAASPAAWNLVVACDMPALTVDFLKGLLEAAESSDADALVPAWPSGWLEPLCAVYRRELAGPLADILRRGERQAVRALASLDVVRWPITQPEYFENLNTSHDWARHCQARLGGPDSPALTCTGPVPPG